MDNQLLEQIATAANTRRKRNKANTFVALLDLIGLSYPVGPDEVEALADLYAFFLPARVKDPKTSAQWVAQAIDPHQIREGLKYMYGDGSVLVATDAHRLHIATYTDRLYSVGFYDREGQAVGHEATFPDYLRVIPTKTSKVDLPEFFQVSFFGGVHFYKIGQHGYNRQYIDSALTGLEIPVVGVGGDGKLVIDGVGPAGERLKAVIMPINLDSYTS